jgi:prophage antirepressor-like protein
MGIELDVLIGHPEHDLLFVATQVGRAAGLKDPGSSIRTSKRRLPTGTVALSSLTALSAVSLPKEPNGCSLRVTTVLMPESTVYDMLLKGRAPQSEPFRKWVTEEVLPTIRKTGKYDAEQSTNPIAMGLMDELKALRGASVREKQGARWALALENSRRDAAV